MKIFQEKFFSLIVIFWFSVVSVVLGTNLEQLMKDWERNPSLISPEAEKRTVVPIVSTNLEQLMKNWENNPSLKTSAAGMMTLKRLEEAAKTAPPPVEYVIIDISAGTTFWNVEGSNNATTPISSRGIRYTDWLAFYNTRMGASANRRVNCVVALDSVRQCNGDAVVGHVVLNRDDRCPSPDSPSVEDFLIIPICRTHRDRIGNNSQMMVAAVATRAVQAKNYGGPRLKCGQWTGIHQNPCNRPYPVCTDDPCKPCPAAFEVSDPAADIIDIATGTTFWNVEGSRNLQTPFDAQGRRYSNWLAFYNTRMGASTSSRVTCIVALDSERRCNSSAVVSHVVLNRDDRCPSPDSPSGENILIMPICSVHRDRIGRNSQELTAAVATKAIRARNYGGPRFDCGKWPGQQSIPCNESCSQK